MFDRLAAKIIVHPPGHGQSPPRATQSGQGHRIKRQVAAFILLSAPIIYFDPAVLGRLILVLGDGWSHGIMVRMLTGRMIAQGEAPLWNPHIFGGMPLLASIQPGSLYPLNWLFAVLPPGAAINVAVIASYQIALVGAYLYARSICLSRLSSLIAALAFAFGGFLIAHLDQTNVVAVASWLPWMLWAIERLSKYCRWRDVVLGALIVALQFFAGHPQTSWQITLLAGAYFIFSLIFRRPASGRLRFGLLTTLMGVCGGLLCAVQLLPTLELQQQGERAAISYEYFGTLSMPAHHLLTLIFPFFFGGGYGPLYRVGAWDYWWTVKWAFCYVGVVGLLLACIGCFSSERRRQVCFWAGVAIIAMILAQGEFLPFELNRLLYRIPVYNLFRGSYRHLLEVNFALAVLAGIGADYLLRSEKKVGRNALRWGSLSLTILVGLTTITYLFFAKFLKAEAPPPPNAASLLNPEAFIPLLFFALALPAAAWAFRRRDKLSGFVLATLLLLDLASFGWFSHWRAMGQRSTASLADPPAVKAIKQREADLNSFRALSHTPQIFGGVYGTDYELLNHQNMSIVRGLQGVNGYDPLRIPRFAQLAGGMDISGMVTDPNAFGLADRGFDLLNVKYLICERRGPLDSNLEPVINYEGVKFSATPMLQKLNPNLRRLALDGGVWATDLALVTTMANSTLIPDGAPVVKLRLRIADGQILERELQAGRDTSEWAYDRSDVRASVKHARAKIAENFPAGGFEGHYYLARVAFPRSMIESVEFEYLRPDAELAIFRASLRDAESGMTAPLDNLVLPKERWREVENFGRIRLYENLKALPRAWFVKRVVTLPQADVLRAIKEGSLPDGSVFDPADTALLELEDYSGRQADWAPSNESLEAEARVTRYEPHRIEITARATRRSLLVLSEVYYPGWEAWIDGVRSPVERVNHALRGIVVPQGDHRIEFVFRAHSFRRGALYSGLGALILLAGAVVHRRRTSIQS